jgi:hypothetical protein
LELHIVGIPNGTKTVGNLACKPKPPEAYNKVVPLGTVGLDGASSGPALHEDTASFLQVALHAGFVKSGLLDLTISGVVAAEASACQQLINQTDWVGPETWNLGSKDPVPQALLSFCGSNDLVFFDDASMVNVKYNRPTALLAFANGTEAVFRHAVFLNNSGPVLAVLNSTVWVTDGSIVQGHRGSRYGGAFVVASNGSLVITNSSMILNNSAELAGGAVYLDGGNYAGAHFWLDGESLISNNSAVDEWETTWGGGIASFGDSAVVLRGGSVLANNLATGYGGSLGVSGRSLTTVAVVTDGVKIANSTADQGGGIAVAGPFLAVCNGSTVTGNRAVNDGGGISLESGATLAMFNRVQVSKNTASGGGGGGGGVLAVNADGLVFRDVVFEGNNCSGLGGGLLVMQLTGSEQDKIPQNVFVSSSVIRGNFAREGGGGLSVAGWPIGDPLLVHIHDTKIENNHVLSSSIAATGGGIGFYDNVVCWFNNSIATGNIAPQGGGMYLGNRVLMLLTGSNTSVADNNATTFQGGGIAVSQLGRLGIDPGASFLNNTAYRGGNNVWEDPIGLNVMGTSEVRDFASRSSRDTGVISTAVKLLGRSGFPLDNAVLVASLNSSDLLGGMQRTDVHGVANFPYLKLQGQPGKYILNFRAIEFPFLPAVNFTVHVRGCHVGEVTNVDGDVCEPCLEGSYSLNPRNTSCDPCPAEATCPGGHVIIPLQGFWHSLPYSPQIHRWVEGRGQQTRNSMASCSAMSQCGEGCLSGMCLCPLYVLH